METSPSAEIKALVPATRGRKFPHPRMFINALGRIFPRSRVAETVATTVHFAATAELIWQRLMFYEEVKTRPRFLLRLFLPRPISTEGGKTQAGSIIRCRYEGGTLMKRITEVEVERCIEFEVLEQNLGLDGCISMTTGSYRLRPVSGGCEIVLTTNYRGHLLPRRLWQPLERYLAHQLHRHILDGMRAEVQQ